MTSLFEEFCKQTKVNQRITVKITESDALLGKGPWAHPDFPATGAADYVQQYAIDPATRKPFFPSPVYHRRITHLDPDPLALCFERGLLRFGDNWIQSGIVFGPNHPTPGQPLPSNIFVTGMTTTGWSVWRLPGDRFLRDYRSTEKLATEVPEDEKAETEFINLCRDLVRQSDTKIIRTQFPTLLDKVLQNPSYGSLFRSLETVALATWLSQGVEAWRRAPRSLEARLLWDVAEASNAITIGFIDAPRGVTSVDQLKTLVKTILASAPVPLWKSTEREDKEQSPITDQDFSWTKFFRENLEWAFRQTAESFANYGPDLPKGKGINIVDDVLKELAGVMRLEKLKLPIFEK